jgi:hypothetical protein
MVKRTKRRKIVNDYMKTIEGFRLRKLGNEYILVGESMALINFNKMITLNETAGFLWEKAQEATANLGGFTAQALCEALCAEYEVTPEQALTDVQSTLDSWLEAGVIEA